MENALSALIVIGVMILSMLGLTERSITSQAQIAQATQAMQQRQLDRSGTNLAAIGATTSALGSSVTLTFQNTGRVRLINFDRWDVFLAYTDGVGNFHVGWYANPAQWTSQIYQTLSPPTSEVFEPGILNSGEYIVVQVSVEPAVGAGTTNMATVSTPSGITASTVFTR